MIILHILIAITSIILTTLAFVRPTRRHLQLNYTFIGLTLGSGTYLILTAPAHMLEICTVGIVYLVASSAFTILAHIKLAKLQPVAVRLD